MEVASYKFCGILFYRHSHILLQGYYMGHTGSLVDSFGPRERRENAENVARTQRERRENALSWSDLTALTSDGADNSASSFSLDRVERQKRKEHCRLCHLGKIGVLAHSSRLSLSLFLSFFLSCCPTPNKQPKESLIRRLRRLCRWPVDGPREQCERSEHDQHDQHSQQSPRWPQIGPVGALDRKLGQTRQQIRVAWETSVDWLRVLPITLCDAV